MAVRFGCYVGNVDSSISLDVLKQLFSQCGTILDASLNGKDTDPFRFGFIDFASEADRERAFKLDGSRIAGRTLKVSSSKGNTGRKDAPPGGMPMMPGYQQHGYPPQNPMMQQGPGALLLQLVQGGMDIRTMTPEQQQTLTAHMMMMNSQPPPPMQHHHHHHHQGGMAQPFQPRGGYLGRGGGNPRFVSPNPQPNEEQVKLREIQRKQFFDQVRKQAEKYERKLQEKVASTNNQSSKRSNSSASSKSSSSSGAELDEKRLRTEEL